MHSNDSIQSKLRMRGLPPNDQPEKGKRLKNIGKNPALPCGFLRNMHSNDSIQSKLRMRGLAPNDQPEKGKTIEQYRQNTRITLRVSSF